VSQPPIAHPDRSPGVADDEWQHLHPLSPVLRGGVVLLAFLGYVLSQIGYSVVSALSPGNGSPAEPGNDPGWEQIRAFPLLALAGLVLVVAGAAGLGWLSWRFSRFRIASNQVELRTGWLFRQHRQVPMERVQAVEISRPILAQILGLSAVVVQSAGGRDAQLKLAFLGRDRADQVREHLMRLAGRADERTARPMPGAVAPGSGPEATSGGPLGPARHPVDGSALPAEGAWAGAVPAATVEHEVVAVPNTRLLLATLLHGSTIFLLVLIVLAGGVAASLAATRLGPSVGVVLAGMIPGLAPLLLGIGANRVKELLQHGNFTVADLGTSVRLRHGLTDQRTTTIPLHRVQALELLQPLWWRPFGWWRVRVNVAGVHGDEHDPTSQTAALPVAPLADALRVVALIDPAADLDSLTVAVQGEGGEPGWTTVSPRARVLDPWSWRRRGYAVSAHSVVVRSGRFSRVAALVPHARIQSLTLDQGPLDRSLDLASVTLVSTPGPVSARIAHLTVDEAHRFLAEESRRSAAARTALEKRPAGTDVLGVARTAPDSPFAEHTGSEDYSRRPAPGPMERDER
jgi:putative membrane protein